jgi:hypothetical protein
LLQHPSPDKPIITLKEAKKLLGKEARLMSDVEIRQLVQSYDEIAKLIIKDYEILKTSV